MAWIIRLIKVEADLSTGHYALLVAILPLLLLRTATLSGSTSGGWHYVAAAQSMA